MQEPVLFNTDIKTNILFGKPDATDEEIYIAAQKANALQFIESNTEDLTPEQKKENLDSDFKKAFDAINEKHPNVANLHQEFADSHDRIKQLIMELLNSIDEDILTRASANPQSFLNSIKKCSDKFGSGWADIVMDFTWPDEYQKICKEP